MALLTVALVLHDIALVLHAPTLSAQGGGSISASTGATLAAGAIVATLTTALAVLSAPRAA